MCKPRDYAAIAGSDTASNSTSPTFLATSLYLARLESSVIVAADAGRVLCALDLAQHNPHSVSFRRLPWPRPTYAFALRVQHNIRLRRIRTAERRILTPHCQARGLQRGAPIRALRLQDATAREASALVALHKFHGRPLTAETRVLQLAACKAFVKDVLQSGPPKILPVELRPGEFNHRPLLATQVELRFDSRPRVAIPPLSTDSHACISDTRFLTGPNQTPSWLRGSCRNRSRPWLVGAEMPLERARSNKKPGLTGLISPHRRPTWADGVGERSGEMPGADAIIRLAGASGDF